MKSTRHKAISVPILNHEPAIAESDQNQPWPRILCRILAASVSLTAATGTLQAGNLYIPNASFESPSTTFVDTRIDHWQKSPKPAWYDEASNGPWDQLMGIFLNTPTNSSSHIDNCDGNQAAFLFALPQVALFQDYSSTDWSRSVPSHAFAARFKVGKSYHLKVGVIGGGGGMTNGATMQLSLYYRDAASNLVTVAATMVTNTASTFSNTTHLVDFTVDVPAVQPSDAWAGQYIGIQLLSTVGFDMTGGYWDVDNVRLSETIEVPNGSFESPATTFVDTRIDRWQKSPKPVWYDETSNGPWDQLMGIFLNTPTNNASHIDNCDGSQAAFLFALPQVALFQDYSSTDWSNSVPSHAFNARFEIGSSYHLAVGVIGGGGGMTNGATMQLSLYYRDAASNLVTVAATMVTNTPSTFLTTTHLVDFKVDVAAVKATDPWAGQNVGIQLLSTVGFAQAGGYWDVDNVRLTQIIEPTLLSPARSSGQFTCTLQSEPGLKFELLTTTNLLLPRTAWTSMLTLTNVSGTTPVIDTAPIVGHRFYAAHQIP
jgi:hypothetical protein